MRNFALLFLITFCFIQCKTPQKSLDSAAAEKYSKVIDTEDLKEKLYTISSDEFEGRDTGEAGQKKAAEYIKNFYKKNKIAPPKETNEYFQHIPSSFFNDKIKASENVIAVIEGSELPEEIVVVSAHYDHLGVADNGEIYNGADDDGSGTVAVMQMAKAFKKATKKDQGPRRTIVFLHFTGEEKGLLGSKYYTENPIFPLKNTIANLNIDMIGRLDDLHKSDPDYIYLIGSNRLSTELDSVVNQQNRKHTKLQLDYKYNDKNDPSRLYYRSDHYNFAKHDIPVIFFFSGLHEDYHKTTDTADKINYELMTHRTKLIFYTLWEIANRKERIKVDKAY